MDGTCIQNYGGFGNIKDCEMTTHGGVGISQRSFNEKGYIEKIENVTIKDVTEEGGHAGIYSEGSATPVPLIGNCTIENYTTGIRNFTGIDAIKDCSITDVGVGIRTSAEIMEMEWGEHFKGDIGELSGNRIVSKNQALLVTRGGSVEEIKSGWYENTAGDNEDSRKSLSITGSESEVSTVSGGTFVGSGDSVYIDEGSLGKIIGSLDRFPVFYGKNGYAINNEKEASKINIEPNLSKETIGYARYLGTKDRQIINTPEKDTYPVHARDSETYFMSRIATDSAVKDLEGKPFHYLTVYVYLDYDKNAKDATGDMTGDIQKVEAGTQVTVGDNKFTRTGYKFLNWDTDPAGIAYDPKDKLVLLEDTTFYAKWTLDTYNISYQNLKGASNSNPTTYTYNDTSITLQPPTDPTGYTFEGWYDNSSFSGNTITAIPANSTGDKTFYAKWMAVKYDISYQNLNGASNSNPATYTIEDATITLVPPTGATGYIFEGWYDNDTFSGKVIEEIPANSTGNKTFYAKWTAETYNISYQNLKGASNSNPTTYTVADTITLAALPNVTGYTFDGWYDNADLSGSPITAISAGITGDLTFYAKWTKISYNNAKGNGDEWTKGNKAALAFIFKRSVDDGTTFSHFKGITVDGKAVPEKDSSGKANWTAKSGSVIIELQSSYLETLSVGEHKLAVQFDDGADATATFTVKAKPATPTVTPTKAATASGKAKTTSPKTGDESNMLLWFLLICASLFVMFRIISLRNRRFNDR